MRSAGEVLRGGAWIGALERAAVFASVVAGWPEGVAIVLGLKGLGRYPELPQPAAHRYRRAVHHRDVHQRALGGCLRGVHPPAALSRHCPIMAGVDDAHPARESITISGQRAVQPQLDQPRQFLGVTEVHGVRRPLDDGDRHLLVRQPAHLSHAGRRWHEWVAATQDRQSRDGSVEQTIQGRKEGQLVEQAESVHRSEPEVVRQRDGEHPRALTSHVLRQLAQRTVQRLVLHASGRRDQDEAVHALAAPRVRPRGRSDSPSSSRPARPGRCPERPGPQAGPLDRAGMSRTLPRRSLRPYPGRSGTRLTRRPARARAVGMRYAPEMAKPWMWTTGTPLPPILRRQWRDLPSTSRRSVTHSRSMDTGAVRRVRRSPGSRAARTARRRSRGCRRG